MLRLRAGSIVLAHGALSVLLVGNTPESVDRFGAALAGLLFLESGNLAPVLLRLLLADGIEAVCRRSAAKGLFGSQSPAVKQLLN